MLTPANSGRAFAACVPHAPLVKLQEGQKWASPDFWQAYDACVAAFDAFDPELVIVFGSDHYSNLHLKLMPGFMIGHRAEAIGDSGGIPGRLDVPMELTLALSHHLVGIGFDVATSYAMRVDHGFSNVLNFFLHGRLDSRPVIPVFVNALAEPRPRLARCRALGDAIGAWTTTTGKRVAFLGSGGLSHKTGAFFPQFHTAPDDRVRHYIVHGGSDQGITEADWHDDISGKMYRASAGRIAGNRASTINPDWDRRFLADVASGELTRFDRWTDEDILREGGEGGSEIRMWVAALAAGEAAGGGTPVIDYYSDDTSIGVGAAVVRMPA